MRQVLRLDLNRRTTTDLAAPWLIRPLLWPDGTIGAWEVCWQGLRADQYPDTYPSRDAAFLAVVGEGPTSHRG
jgi:hypothetical protein